MSLRINTNVQALNGHRQMIKNDNAVSKSLEKLSSGLKINRAADNAAGLIISEQLRAQLGGLRQAMDNTEQSVSLVQTAEGALDEMNTLLSKAKKLALGSMSSATADAAQRSANNIEYTNILSSLQRIATQTQYAQNKLLNGTYSAGANKMVQVGAFGGQNTKVAIATMTAACLAASLTTVTLKNAVSATAALSNIEEAITKVTSERGKLGALQANTLETTLNSLRVSFENLKAAESTIRDVDFAEESANFTRNTILVQSATSMLAQANQMPQNVLKLLG